ncbi:MAG: hypothetical protein ABJN57_05015 [Hyphomicrobiales bacterium]
MAVICHSNISGASCSSVSCAAFLKEKSVMIFSKGFLFSKAFLSLVVFATITTVMLLASEGLLLGLLLILGLSLISLLLISPEAEQTS